MIFLDIATQHQAKWMLNMSFFFLITYSASLTFSYVILQIPALSLFLFDFTLKNPSIGSIIVLKKSLFCDCDLVRF